MNTLEVIRDMNVISIYQYVTSASPITTFQSVSIHKLFPDLNIPPLKLNDVV